MFLPLSQGTDVAMDAASIVLVKNDLRDVITALDLSSTVFKRIKLNFVWALGYNILGIPIAAGVMFPLIKVRLPPELAAFAMALSSVSVILSSLALRMYKKPVIRMIEQDAFSLNVSAEEAAEHELCCPCDECGCSTPSPPKQETAGKIAFVPLVPKTSGCCSAQADGPCGCKCKCVSCKCNK